MAVMESERGKFCVYDPSLGWTGKPGAAGDFSHLDCRHRVGHNKYGFRGAEYGFARTARKRVAVLGDSFVWGFGVEDEDVFTSVIEREGGSSPEMVNLGVSGYGTDQEYLLWRSLGRRFEPDEVLLAVVPHNDLRENAGAEAYGCPKPVIIPDKSGGIRSIQRPAPRRGISAGPAGIPPFAEEIIGGRHPAARLAARSALVSAALVALSRHEVLRVAMEERRMLIPRKYMTLPSPNVYLDPSSAPVCAADWERLFGLIDAFRSDVLESGAKFRLLIVPSIVQVYPELWEEFIRTAPLPSAEARWAPEVPNRLIKAYCEEHRVPLTDPLPALRLAARRNAFLYFPLNNHWTAEAHRIAARELIKDMR